MLSCATKKLCLVKGGCFQGFLRRNGAQRVIFDGEFVVKWGFLWCFSATYFRAKTRHVSNLFFAWSNSGKMGMRLNFVPRGTKDFHTVSCRTRSIA
jgi:hypothetical protein